MGDPYCQHSFPAEMAAIVYAVAARARRRLPCKSVWVRYAGLLDPHVQSLAQELGVASVVHLW